MAKKLMLFYGEVPENPCGDCDYKTMCLKLGEDMYGLCKERIEYVGQWKFLSQMEKTRQEIIKLMRDEGIEFWITSFKGGKPTALKHIPMEELLKED